MAKQTIGVGLAANDGGGDPLRSAFVKVNENFTELYDSIPSSVPATLTDLGIADGTNGQVLTTNGSGVFTFTTVSGAGSTLGALTDVSATAATTGQVLKWDGTQWAPGTDSGGGSGIALTDLSVAAEPAASGDGGLAYDNATGIFTFTPPVIPADLNDLGISDGTNGQVLTTDGSGNYTFEDASGGGGGSSTFSGLTEISTADVDAHDIALQAKTTHIMTPNGSSAYRSDIYGTADNPTIYVRAGETIAFDLTDVTSSHPFQIETSGGSAYNDGLIHIATNGTRTTGASAQGKTSGTLYWKVPGTISGTYKYICTVHGSMIGDIEIEAAAGASGGSGLNTRTLTNTLNSGMANGATANFDLSAAKTFVLYSIEVSDAAWVRLYIDTASRTADASRTRGNDPAPDAGVIAEVITTGSETVKFGPAVIGYCSTGNIVPAAVTNDSGGTANIDVTITHLSLEA